MMMMMIMMMKMTIIVIMVVVIVMTKSWTEFLSGGERAQTINCLYVDSDSICRESELGMVVIIMANCPTRPF